MSETVCVCAFVCLSVCVYAREKYTYGWMKGQMDSWINGEMDD